MKKPFQCSSLEPRARERKAFTLIEIMLATAIFALVVVALATCLSRAIDAEILRERDSDIRMNLQSRLAEARLMEIKPGKETLEPDNANVTYEKEIVSLNLKNEKGQPLPGLYSLIIRAHWEENQQPQERQAQIYVYQP